jgi:hypothetical protein
LDEYPVNESTYFEIDRSVVLGHLAELQRTVDEGATQLEMVAAEEVFDKGLSRAFTRKAEKLHAIARDLKSLLRSVAKAQIPGAAERPKTKSEPRSRRKA